MSTSSRTARAEIWRLLATAIAALLASLVLLPREVYGQKAQTVAETTSSTSEFGRLEVQMWDMINRDRGAPSQMEETKGRAQPLVWDARLAAVARAHSEEMARDGYFSHRGEDGSLPMWRVSQARIQWLSTGENIAKASDVVQAETIFMNEPKFERNHRGNILNPNYTRVGIGIAKGPDGFLYITQEFAEVR
jgi:uncharacterized protein YkwD